MPSASRPVTAIVPIPVLAGRLIAPPSGPHIVRILFTAAGLRRRLDLGGRAAVILAVLVVLLSTAILLLGAFAVLVVVARGPVGTHGSLPGYCAAAG
jgi:hypothetical protein